MEDNRDYYEKVQRMVQKEATDIAVRTFDTKIKEYEFANFQTPKHVHNGIDSDLLIDTDILPGGRIATVLTPPRNTTGNPVTASLPIRNVVNPKRLSFYGYANNGSGAYGVTTGQVTFGKCYPGSGIPFVLSSNPLPFVEACNFMYVSGGMSTSVLSGTGQITGLVQSGGGTVAAYNLLDYSENTLFFEIFLADTWLIGGSIIIE